MASRPDLRKLPGVAPYRVRMAAGNDQAETWVLMAASASEAIESAAELCPGRRVIGCRLMEAW